MELGEKIKQRRTLLMLTQEELANRCELTKGYISQLENDKVSPSIETLSHILEVLGTNLSDFFYEEKEEMLVYDEEEQYEKNFDGYLQTWLVPTSQEKAWSRFWSVFFPERRLLKTIRIPEKSLGMS